jgi:hypothetical protein
MRQATLKYQIWQIMLAIAVLAGLFASFGLTGAVTMLVVITFLLLPILRVAHGRGIRTAAWICSLYPVLLLGSLYATWFTAWCILGHRPRSSLDDPKFISPIVLVPHDTTYLFILGSPFALLLCVTLVLAYLVQSVRAEVFHPHETTAQLLIALCLWSSLLVISRWNLFDFDYVLGWFMD